MPAYNAITDTILLSVLRYGSSTLVAGSGETLTTDIGKLPEGVPLKYTKVVGGNLVEMTTGEKTAIDNATPEDNAFLGTSTLENITTGNCNTAVGDNALPSLTTGNDNIAIGNQSGSNYTGDESDNILLGHPGVVRENGKIRIGTNTQTSTFIRGIHGVTPGSTTETVIIDANGELGSTSASTQSITYISTDRILSVSLSTTNTHNWNPSGLQNANLIRISSTQNNRYLTGIMAPPSGVAKIITLVNIGDENDNNFSTTRRIYLSHNEKGSTSNNRILLRDYKTEDIKEGDSCRLWYDHISNRWRCFGSGTH